MASTLLYQGYLHVREKTLFFHSWKKRYVAVHRQRRIPGRRVTDEDIVGWIKFYASEKQARTFSEGAEPLRVVELNAQSKVEEGSRQDTTKTKFAYHFVVVDAKDSVNELATTDEVTGSRFVNSIESILDETQRNSGAAASSNSATLEPSKSAPHETIQQHGKINMTLSSQVSVSDPDIYRGRETRSYEGSNDQPEDKRFISPFSLLEKQNQQTAVDGRQNKSRRRHSGPMSRKRHNRDRDKHILDSKPVHGRQKKLSQVKHRQNRVSDDSFAKRTPVYGKQRRLTPNTSTPERRASQ